jgi:outer membrane protein TolC
LLTGGQVTLQATENYLKENAPTDILNPTYAPTLSISFQHALLNGFGVAVNARQITVAQINRRMSDLNFKSTVISVVGQVLDNYYQLVAADEDLKAKRHVFDVAGTLYSNVQRQVVLGSVAPPELITSENLVVTSKQDVINSQATRDQLEITLKNLLSRNGSADPVLGPARIVPIDRLNMPTEDGLGDLSSLVKEARGSRVELAVDTMNIESSKASMLGTRNGILPNVQVFGGESQAGLAGPARFTGPNGADPYFIGGLADATGQVLRRNFPTERIGFFAQAPIGNGQALADQAIDELSLRQTELAAQKRSAQIEVDIQNGLIALRQARAQYQAAVKNRELQEQLVAAERKKYELGASVPSNVIQNERDLSSGQSTELTALTSYIRARVSLDRTLGRTLEANHVTVEQAMDGRVKPSGK